MRVKRRTRVVSIFGGRERERKEGGERPGALTWARIEQASVWRVKDFGAEKLSSERGGREELTFSNEAVSHSRRWRSDSERLSNQVVVSTFAELLKSVATHGTTIPAEVA